MDAQGDEIIRPEDEAGPALRGGRFLVSLEKAGEDTVAAGFRLRLESDKPYPLCIVGIEAARRAGMNVVALATTFPRDMLSGYDMLIDDFTQTDSSIVDKF